MQDEFQERFQKLRQDILELKTAKTMPSMAKMYRIETSLPAGTYTELIFELTFADEPGNDMYPITVATGSITPMVMKFDLATNTQKIIAMGTFTWSITLRFWIFSNRKILSITRVQ